MKKNSKTKKKQNKEMVANLVEDIVQNKLDAGLEIESIVISEENKEFFRNIEKDITNNLYLVGSIEERVLDFQFRKRQINSKLSDIDNSIRSLMEGKNENYTKIKELRDSRNSMVCKLLEEFGIKDVSSAVINLSEGVIKVPKKEIKRG